MAQKSKEPPGPDGYPVIGSLLQYAREPFEFQRRCVDEYGDVVRIRALNQDAYLVAHPDYVEQVLDTDFEKYGRPPGLDEVFGDGLVVLEGEFWQEQRKLVQPAFFRDRIAEYAELIVNHAQTKVDSWDDGGVYTIGDEMDELVTEILAKTVFGSTLDYDESNVRQYRDWITGKFEPINSQIPTAIPTPGNRRFKRGQQNLREVAEEVIERERDADDTTSSVASMLVSAQADDSVELSDETLRDHLITLLIGGTDTTGLALTYAWYLLSKNPAVERKFHDEIDEVVGDSPPSMDTLLELDYTEKVVKETLRMYPPANGLSRRPKEDVEIGGYEIPEGSQLLLTPRVSHYDERFFEDPHTFRPDRWSKDLERDLHDFAYFPFGGGPARCVGERMALFVIKFVMAIVGTQFELELTSERDELELTAALTVSPEDPIEMRARER